jgi:tetratricopeptide (TPR) repeat protein
VTRISLVQLYRPHRIGAWAGLFLLLVFYSLAAYGQGLTDSAREQLAKANALFGQARTLESSGQWAQALPLRRQTLEILERSFGDGSPDTDEARSLLAASLVRLGQYAEARQVLEQCLQARTKVLGPNSPAAAEILLRLAECYRREGQPTNAVPLLIRVERGLPQTNGNESLYATALNNHAAVALELGDKPAAEQLLSQSLQLLRGARAPNPVTVTTALTSLGELHRSLGQVSAARAEHEQALALLANAPSGNLVRLVVSNNLASVFRDLRQLPEAIAIYTNTLALLSQQRGADDLDMLKVRRNCAQALALAGDHTAALTVIEDALARLRAAGATNQLSYVAWLSDRGDRQQDLGDLAAARQTFQTVRELAIAEAGPDDSLACGATERLATLAVLGGDLARAHDLLEQALAARRRNASADPRRLPELASCYENWAVFERVLGRANEADRFLQQAFQIQVEHLGRNHPEVADLLEQRVLLAEENGANAEAMQFNQEVLRIRTAAFGRTNLLVAQSRMNIAAEQARIGDVAHAQKELEAARVMVEQLAGPDYPLAAMASFNEANAMSRLGQFDKAAPLYHTALESFERQQSRHISVTARDYALNEVDRGRLESATELTKQALATQESLWRDVLRFGSEQDRLSWHGLSDLLTPLAAVASRDARPLSTGLLRLKSAVLDSLIEDLQLANAGVGDGSAAALASARSKLYRLELSATSHRPPSESGLRQARQELEWQESKLAQTFSALGERRRAFDATPEAVQAKLPPDTVLVEYARYRHWLGQGRTEPCFGAMVYQKNAAPHWVELGSASGTNSIGDLATNFIGQLHLKIPPSTDTLVSLLRGLRERAWDKVQATIPASTRWVIVAPDAELNFVPFAVLWDEGHFLGEKFSFHYVSSARDVLAPNYQAPALRSVDIWADPQLARATWQRVVETTADNLKTWWAVRAVSGIGPDSLPLSYEPLRFARAEGEAVARSARCNACAPVRLFTDDAARENTLRQRPPPYVLHFATHGTFLPEPAQPASDGLLNTSGPHSVQNPMSRRGWCWRAPMKRCKPGGAVSLLIPVMTDCSPPKKSRR